jgi:hypothetical protein
MRRKGWRWGKVLMREEKTIKRKRAAECARAIRLRHDVSV